MSQTIDKIIAEINKFYNDENIINRASKFKNLSIASISSGSLFLDWCIGRGFPRGKIIELYGVESAGKSLIATFATAEAQKLGGECVWIDAENAFDPDFAARLGVDIQKLIISQSSVGEPTLDLVCKLLEAEPDMVIIDSVASMIPKIDLEEPLEQPVIATRARMMSRGLSKLNALNKKTTIVFINQLRSTLSLYGSPTTTSGGRALGHYSSVRIEVKRGDFIEENKTRIGQVVKFRVTKNKTNIPWREGYFKYLYEGKINHEDELVSLAILNKKIQFSGAWLEILGEKFQGRESLEKKLQSDSEFLKKFKDLINATQMEKERK